MRYNILALLFCLILLMPEIGILSPEEGNYLNDMQIEEFEVYSIEFVRPDNSEKVELQYPAGEDICEPVIMNLLIRGFIRTASFLSIPLKFIKMIILAVFFILITIITSKTRFVELQYLLLSSPIFIMMLISRPFSGFILDMPALVYTIIVIMALHSRFARPNLVVFTAGTAVLMLNPHNCLFIILLILFYTNRRPFFIAELKYRDIFRAVIFTFSCLILIMAVLPFSLNRLDFVYNMFSGLRYNFWFFALLPVLLLRAGRLKPREVAESALLVIMFLINNAFISPNLNHADSTGIINSGLIVFPLILYLALYNLVIIFGRQKRVFALSFLVNTLISAGIAMHYYGQLRALPAFIQQGFDEYWVMVFQQFINPL